MPDQHIFDQSPEPHSLNLFILDRDPLVAAAYNCDKHVCKIILEATQMLSLAHIEHGVTHTSNGVELWNARTHRNNHVSRWVRETSENYEWTSRHAMALLSEYRDRYGREHAATGILEWLSTNPAPLASGSLTEFRQAVADDCYHADPVVAYQMYYVRYKSRFAAWRTGKVPAWYISVMARFGVVVDTTPSRSYLKELNRKQQLTKTTLVR